MKHLPDLLSLGHRHLLFHSSVHLSIHLSVCLSTFFMSKFDIYVKVSILINYKTKQPSNLAWNFSQTSWLGRYIDPVTLTYFSRSRDFDTIYIDVLDLLKYKAYNYQTLHSTSPRCTDSAGTLTWWPWRCAPVTLTHLAPMFNISSTKGLQPSNLAKCFFSIYWIGRYLDLVTLTFILAAVTLT